MPFQDVAAKVVRGFAGAAGNTQADQEVGDFQQRREDEKQNKIRMQIAPLALAAQGIQSQMPALLDPATGKPRNEADQKRFDELHDQLSDIIQKQRMILSPPPKEDPHGLGHLMHTATDKLHITNNAVAKAREAQKAKIADYNAQGDQQVKETMQGVVPSQLNPQETQEAARIKAGLVPKDTTEQERFVANYKIQHPGATDEQALRAFTDATTKTPATKVPKGLKAMEQGGVALGVEDQDTGKQYLASQMNDPATPQNVKDIWKTIQDAQAAKQAELDKKDREREARAAKTQSNVGTWAVQEDENGSPMLFNSKTGETREAPSGLHKSGYFAKQIAPLEAANLNIDNYMNGKVFDGAGDLSLQHEFFTATQPSTGFRMTKVQQDILQSSQSWLNSLKAKAYHLATGTWFSPEQRVQIARAAQEAIAAKKQVLQAGGPKTAELMNSGGGWQPPADAPAAPSADNKYLYDENKKPIAKSQGGRWVQP